MFDQHLDPARSIAGNGHGFVINRSILIMLTSFEHEVDGAKDFVADGDDGAFVAALGDKGLELGLEYLLGPAGGMGELA